MLLSRKQQALAVGNKKGVYPPTSAIQLLPQSAQSNQASELSPRTVQVQAPCNSEPGFQGSLLNPRFKYAILLFRCPIAPWPPRDCCGHGETRSHDWFEGAIEPMAIRDNCPCYVTFSGQNVGIIILILTINSPARIITRIHFMFIAFCSLYMLLMAVE